MVSCNGNRLIRRLWNTGMNKTNNIIYRVLDFECRIASTCCGLIEFIHGHGAYEGDWIGQIVPQASKLVHTIPRLLHRSVKEFLEEQDALPGISSRGG